MLASNGRNFGVNAHLAANPTPCHQLMWPKPKGGVIKVGGIYKKIGFFHRPNFKKVKTAL
jgi:hypothetical protein